MAKAGKRLDRMRQNPSGWRIADIKALCKTAGLRCTAPTRGDHYKISHPAVPDILTVPAHRPIKPFYVRKLVEMIDTIAGSDQEELS